MRRVLRKAAGLTTMMAVYHAGFWRLLRISGRCVANAPKIQRRACRQKVSVARLELDHAHKSGMRLCRQKQPGREHEIWFRRSLELLSVALDASAGREGSVGAATPAAAALARRIAIAAIYRAITARLERHRRRLPACRTNDGSSLRRSGTVTRPTLIILLGLSARFAAFRR